jgi:membrane protein implicated in regulation of membrane protease activity
MALSSSLLMKIFAVPEELIHLAVFCVVASAILTNFMWVRSMGIAGISGLSIVYFKLGSSSLPGTVLTILTTVLLIGAVFMAIYADISLQKNSNQGDEKKHEAQF